MTLAYPEIEEGVDVAALDGLAKDLETDRQRALESLLRAVMADSCFVGRRTLGLKAKAA